MMEWQPIESVPNSTEVLFFASNHRIVGLKSRNTFMRMRTDGGYERLEGPLTPTVWQPLPDPPQ